MSSERARCDSQEQATIEVVRLQVRLLVRFLVRFLQERFLQATLLLVQATLGELLLVEAMFGLGLADTRKECIQGQCVSFCRRSICPQAC